MGHKMLPIVSSENDNVRHGDTRGGGACSLGVSHASHLKGAEPQRSQIWGFPSIYVYTFRRRTTEFGVVSW